MVASILAIVCIACCSPYLESALEAMLGVSYGFLALIALATISTAVTLSPLTETTSAPISNLSVALADQSSW